MDQPVDLKAPSMRFSTYEAFKRAYLALDPEIADSPAMVQALIEDHGFDWLNRLVEETLAEEPIETPRVIEQRVAVQQHRHAA